MGALPIDWPRLARGLFVFVRGARGGADLLAPRRAPACRAILWECVGLIPQRPSSGDSSRVVCIRKGVKASEAAAKISEEEMALLMIGVVAGDTTKPIALGLFVVALFVAAYLVNRPQA
jgi:hypothetical protein